MDPRQPRDVVGPYGTIVRVLLVASTRDQVQHFFDKQSEKWSETYYSEEGTMRPRIKRFLDAINHFQSISNKKILDIGCGTGELACAFAKSGAEVSACDLSPQMMDRAIILDVQKQINWVRLENADEDVGRVSVPLEDEQFDIITLSSVLEYVLDLPGSLRELHRLLKPGGMLFTTVPNPAHPDRAGEPGKIALMQYGLVRWLVKQVPRLASYELAYHSRNRMEKIVWAEALESEKMSFIDYQEDVDLSLWMIVAKKERNG